MKLSIVIISYNTEKILADCLKSVLKNCPEAETIVVDNNSSDQSSQMVRSQFPKVKLIESKKNLGFGKANNFGARIASGDIILFLCALPIFSLLSSVWGLPIYTTSIVCKVVLIYKCFGYSC